MRRLISVLTLAALMVALMASSAMPTFAIRDSEYDAIRIRDEENRNAYGVGNLDIYGDLNERFAATNSGDTG